MKFLAYIGKVITGLIVATIGTGVICGGIFYGLTGLGNLVLWITLKAGGPSTMWTMWSFEGFFSGARPPGPIEAACSFLYSSLFFVCIGVMLISFLAQIGSNTVSNFTKKRAQV